jgi:peptide/nickel transport system permease protein
LSLLLLFLVATFLILVVAFAPILASQDPNALNPRAKAAPPSRTHLLGTDEFGRDIFSRFMHGARITLVVEISSVVPAAAQ